MASVLETFFILFETDATDAKKGVDGLNKKLGDTAKVSKKSVDASDKLTKELKKMGKEALTAAAGFFALRAVLSRTLQTITNLDELGKFSRLIGENIGKLSAWQEAIIRVGGSASGFQQTIESLNEKIVDASLKGMNEIVPFFNQLGISLLDTNDKAKTTLDLLPEIAESFEGLTKQQSFGIGKKLGLDKATILLLQKGRKEVELMVEQQGKLGVASKEATEISAKFNREMADLRQVMGFSAQSMLVSVLPALTAVIGGLTELGVWMSDNSELVQGFFVGLGLAVTTYALPAMIALATAAWAAILPFLAIAIPIAAAAVAIALLYEDITLFVNGQESLIGKLVDRWGFFGDVVKFIGVQVKDFYNILKSVFGFLLDLFIAPQRALETMLGLLGGIGGQIKDFFGFGDNDVIVNAKKTLELANGSSLGSQTSSSIQNSSATNSKNTSVKTGDIVINTQATSTDDIASEAAGSLNRQLRTVIDNFDDGVAL